MAILDSGCTKTVCSNTWLECFIETLSNEEKEFVKTEPSLTYFKFGDRKMVHSYKTVKVPTEIVGKKVFIVTEVIEKGVPLLLSKAAMKKAEVKIDFTSDGVYILGCEPELFFSSTGHYCIPVSKKKCLPQMDQALRQVLQRSFLTTDTQFHPKEERVKAAVKLHRQFSHPDANKLKGLLKGANLVDEELFKLIDEISDRCEICEKYKKAKPRPIVGFPMARQFSDTVAMDLKQWSYQDGIWLPHLIDHATYYSLILSRKREAVIEGIFKIWITCSIFGTAGKLLGGNGREFDNKDFRSMCENLNIRICTTAAESPWTNGLLERHNAVLRNMLTKIMTEQSCSLKVAVAWQFLQRIP